jgi:hypothetical protein
MGSLVVGATYFLAYGELFTLVVCVKTTICLAVWLSKRPDGSKVRGGVQGRLAAALCTGLTMTSGPAKLWKWIFNCLAE